MLSVSDEGLMIGDFPEVDSNRLITTSSRGALKSGCYQEHCNATVLQHQDDKASTCCRQY